MRIEKVCEAVDVHDVGQAILLAAGIRDRRRSTTLEAPLLSLEVNDFGEWLDYIVYHEGVRGFARVRTRRTASGQTSLGCTIDVSCLTWGLLRNCPGSGELGP
jgi:hypothetical protein